MSQLLWQRSNPKNIYNTYLIICRMRFDRKSWRTDRQTDSQTDWHDEHDGLTDWPTDGQDERTAQVWFDDETDWQVCMTESRRQKQWYPYVGTTRHLRQSPMTFSEYCSYDAPGRRGASFKDNNSRMSDQVVVCLYYSSVLWWTRRKMFHCPTISSTSIKATPRLVEWIPAVSKLHPILWILLLRRARSQRSEIQRQHYSILSGVDLSKGRLWPPMIHRELPQHWWLWLLLLEDATATTLAGPGNGM